MVNRGLLGIFHGMEDIHTCPMLVVVSVVRIDIVAIMHNIVSYGTAVCPTNPYPPVIGEMIFTKTIMHFVGQLLSSYLPRGR